MLETKEILKAWRNTEIADKVYFNDLGYSRVQLTGADKEPAPFRYREYLTDREMRSVMDALTSLAEDAPELYAVIKSVYVNKMSCSKIAKSRSKRTENIITMLKEGERFIRGRIYEVFKDCQ